MQKLKFVVTYTTLRMNRTRCAWSCGIDSGPSSNRCVCLRASFWKFCLFCKLRWVFLLFYNTVSKNSSRYIFFLWYSITKTRNGETKPPNRSQTRVQGYCRNEQNHQNKTAETPALRDTPNLCRYWFGECEDLEMAWFLSSPLNQCLIKYCLAHKAQR